MKNVKVSVFKHLRDAKGTKEDITLEKIVARISTGVVSKRIVDQFRQGAPVKQNLECILFGGVFSQRNSNSLVKHSGLMVVDFDKYPNQDLMFDQLEVLKKNPHFVLLFISPSGNGIKGVVRIPSATKETHPKFFKAFQDQFNYDYWDAANSNVDRICFESYDPDIYVNYDAEVFKIKTVTNIIPQSEQSEIIDGIMKFNFTRGFVEGERNAYIFDLAGLFCEYGITEANAEGYILTNITNGSFSEQEAKTTIKSAYKSRQFASKEWKATEIKPKYNEVAIDKIIDAKTGLFYAITDNNIVKTTSVMYADFFIEKGFKRISTADDKIQLLINKNNVIDYFNHKTDTVAYLQNHIGKEPKKVVQAIREKLMKDASNIIQQSFLSIEPIELRYYKDTYNTFCLPFKDKLVDCNAIDHTHNCTIGYSSYEDFHGFFAPHKIQKREFTYKAEKGMFETFLERASTGKKDFENEDDVILADKFKAMFGYLCHNYKSRTFSPAVVLTDENANDENRNGRRGKTLISMAIQEVTNVLVKGGLEFDATYTHVFADLDKKHNVYVIDDVPASFKYFDLYTNILGSINCQRKGVKADTIEFEDTPKFLITTNWVLPYDKRNASTNERFREFKFSNYYNGGYSPKQEFGCTFFEDWDLDEWDRFYSFVFRSVNIYLRDGMQQIEYDKNWDNYLASFSSDVKLQEMERIMDSLLTRDSFTVSDFLEVYKNGMFAYDKLFHSNNAKSMIEIYIKNRKIDNISYSRKYKKWEITDEKDLF